ncbi:unnamed protein product, partial [Ixodes hexagonus]
MSICKLCGINWSTVFLRSSSSVFSSFAPCTSVSGITLSRCKGILYQGGHTFITMLSLKSTLSQVKTTRGRISELGLVKAFTFASCCLVICWEGFHKHRHTLPFCIWRGCLRKLLEERSGKLKSGNSVSWR